MRQCRIVVGSILFLILMAMVNYAIADNGVIGVPNSKLTQSSIGAGILKGINTTGGIENISARLTPKATFVIKGTLVHKNNCGDCIASCQLETEDWQLCHDTCYQKYPKDSSCGLKAEFANCEECIKYSPSGEPYRSGWIRSCYAQFDSCNLKQLTCDNCLNTCKDYTAPTQQKQCQDDCKKLFPDTPACNPKACEDCRSGCDAKTPGERLSCYEACSEKVPGVCDYTSCTDCLRNCFPISWDTNPIERRACDDACRKKASGSDNNIFDPCITPSPTAVPKSGVAKGITPVQTVIPNTNCADCLSLCEKSGTSKEACNYACIQKFPKDSSCGLNVEYYDCAGCLGDCPTEEPLRTACLGSCAARYDSCDFTQLTCGSCLASCEKQTGSQKDMCNYACYLKFPKDSSCGIENKYLNCEDCLNSCPAGEPLRSGCINGCMAQYKSCDITKLTCNSCLEGCNKISDLKGKQSCQEDCKSLYQKDSKCEVQACKACQNDCLKRPQNERVACYEVCSKISSVCGYYTGCSDCWQICRLTKEYGSLNPVDPIDCVKRCDSGAFCDEATCSQCKDKCSHYFGSSDLDKCLNMCKTDHTDCDQSSSNEPTVTPTTYTIDSFEKNSGKTGFWNTIATVTPTSDRMVSNRNDFALISDKNVGFATGIIGAGSNDRMVSTGYSNGISTESNKIAGPSNSGSSSSSEIVGIFKPSFMSNSTGNQSTTNKTGKNATIIVRT